MHESMLQDPPTCLYLSRSTPQFHKNALCPWCALALSLTWLHHWPNLSWNMQRAHVCGSRIHSLHISIVKLLYTNIHGTWDGDLPWAQIHEHILFASCKILVSLVSRPRPAFCRFQYGDLPWAQIHEHILFASCKILVSLVPRPRPLFCRFQYGESPGMRLDISSNAYLTESSYKHSGSSWLIVVS